MLEQPIDVANSACKSCPFGYHMNYCLNVSASEKTCKRFKNLKRYASQRLSTLENNNAPEKVKKILSRLRKTSSNLTTSCDSSRSTSLLSFEREFDFSNYYYDSRSVINLSAILQRVRELEDMVKSIPLLKFQIFALKKEKRILLNQLNEQSKSCSKCKLLDILQNSYQELDSQVQYVDRKNDAISIPKMDQYVQMIPHYSDVITTTEFPLTNVEVQVQSTDLNLFENKMCGNHAEFSHCETQVPAFSVNAGVNTEECIHKDVFVCTEPLSVSNSYCQATAICCNSLSQTELVTHDASTDVSIFTKTTATNTDYFSVDVSCGDDYDCYIPVDKFTQTRYIIHDKACETVIASSFDTGIQTSIECRDGFTQHESLSNDIGIQVIPELADARVNTNAPEWMDFMCGDGDISSIVCDVCSNKKISNAFCQTSLPVMEKSTITGEYVTIDNFTQCEVMHCDRDIQACCYFLDKASMTSNSTFSTATSTDNLCCRDFSCGYGDVNSSFCDRCNYLDLCDASTLTNVTRCVNSSTEPYLAFNMITIGLQSIPEQMTQYSQTISPYNLHKSTTMDYVSISSFTQCYSDSVDISTSTGIFASANSSTQASVKNKDFSQNSNGSLSNVSSISCQTHFDLISKCTSTRIATADANIQTNSQAELLNDSFYSCFETLCDPNSSFDLFSDSSPVSQSLLNESYIEENLSSFEQICKQLSKVSDIPEKSFDVDIRFIQLLHRFRESESNQDFDFLVTISLKWFELIKSSVLSASDLLGLLITINREGGTSALEYVINSKDDIDNTALHYYIAKRQFDYVQVLLQTELIRFNVYNKFQITPIMIISLSPIITLQQNLIYKLLFLDRDALNVQEIEGRTALMFASRQGNLSVVRLLCESGANINICDKDGSSALMYAALSGHKDVVKCLLEQPEIDTSWTNKDNATAITLALNSSFKDIAALIYAHDMRYQHRNAASNKVRSESL